MSFPISDSMGKTCSPKRLNAMKLMEALGVNVVDGDHWCGG